MTDTAIPIPEDAAERMAALTRQIREAADQLTRALGTTVRDAEQGVREFARVWRQHEEASAQRWRVARMMPTLTVRGVMVHGYVAHKEA